MAEHNDLSNHNKIAEIALCDFWNTLANLLLGEQTERVLPECTDSVDLANRFNEFYIRKAENIRQCLSSNKDCVIHNEIQHLDLMQKPKKFLSSFQLESTENICKVLQQSASNSCEHDPMPAWLLKQCSDVLLPAITSFINSSLETGFKVSIIRPLLKKDGLDSQKLENYRPVANLSFMSKILEKVVTKQLDGFISLAGLHEPYQSAYHRNHSTETALLKVKSDISSAVDSGLVSVLLMLDMSAAFDTVSHTTLISRLESVFELQGTVLKWFNSYLTGRCQKVVLNGKSSEIAEIGSGVPQGSVLGPRLFTMYTQPLGKIIQKHGLCYHQYAGTYNCTQVSNFNKMFQM